MSLVRIVDVATALAGEADHLLVRVVADRPEGREPGHIEVDAAAGLIREPAIQHHADEPADVGNRRRRTRRRRHGERVHRLHVALEAGLLPCRQVEIVDAQLPRLGEQRIVDVGDVAHTLHRVAEIDEPSLQHVVDDEGRRVAEVCGVVRRDAARVHGHQIVRLERHDGPPSRVVEPHVQVTVLGSKRIPVNFGATRVL
jgi:hypothetical protein